MSVLRQFNFLGQGRVDVPHLRSVESSIAADFDVVAGRVQGGAQALVIRGFTLSNFSSGTAASSVQLSTADGIIYNLNASESGTFLWVPADRAVEVLNPATNSRIVGSFTAGQTNYVGLDLIRQADSTTSDIVQFLDPNTLLENPKDVPLARTLDYQIVIATTPFSTTPNIVPIAKITTDTSNNISSVTPVQDARNMMWRLGSGGDFPNTLNTFSWPQGRVEFTTGINTFIGADKALQSQKDWMNAIMTRIWEIGGGENWYSPTADRNVVMARLPSPAVFGSTGDNFEFVAGLYSVNHLHWQGLRILFDDSNEGGVYYNLIQDQTVDDPAGSAATSKTALSPGQCIYVDFLRSSGATVVAFKANLQTLGTPVIPGSRFVIAWCNTDGSITVRNTALPVNTAVQPATTVAIGGVRLAYTAGAPATPVVPNLGVNNVVNIGTGSYPITGSATALTVVGNSGTAISASVSAAGVVNNPAIIGDGGSGGSGLADGVHGTGGYIVIGPTTSGGNGVQGVAGIKNGIGVVGLGPNFLGSIIPTGQGGFFVGGSYTGVSGVVNNGVEAYAGAGNTAVGIIGYANNTNTSTGGPTPSSVTPGPGIGVVGIGSGGSGGGDGGQFFGRGEATPRNGVSAYGSTPIFSGDNGGPGVSGFGGPGAGTGQGGVGGTFTGGAGGGSTPSSRGGDGVVGNGGVGNSTGTLLVGGAGGNFTGGNATGTGGQPGPGIYATGGTGTSYGAAGVYATGTGNFAGIHAVGGGSGGAGIEAQSGGGGVAADFTGVFGQDTIHTSAANNTFDLNFLNSTSRGTGFGSGKTMKKVLGGATHFTPIYFATSGGSLQADLMYFGTNDMGLTSTSSAYNGSLVTEFTLPLNAVITSIVVRFHHSGTSTGVGALININKFAETGGDWSTTATLLTAVPGYSPAFSAGASSGQNFSLGLVGGSACTSTNVGDLFGIEVTIQANSSGYIYLHYVEINYTMYDTLAWA